MVDPSRAAAEADAPVALDVESRHWLGALRGNGAARDDAILRLHELMVRAARFEIHRRTRGVSDLAAEEADILALETADDAVVAVLARLDDFRGESRFTTWAYKFALLGAGVRLRRRAWRGREVPLDHNDWPLLADTGASPAEEAETYALLGELRTAVEEVLTPHQREVFVTLIGHGVPIDVLAERLSTTRSALYKTLHDARRKLRAHLVEAGFIPLAGEGADR